MAAFMHRGFGRVAYGDLQPASATGTSSTWTYQITPGLPAGALAGARGFVKTDATLTLTNEGTTSCLLAAWADVDGVQSGTEFVYQTVAPQEYETVALTGEAGVDTAGAKTVTIHVDDLSATTCSYLALGNATSTYFPFGSTGTNVAAPARPAPRTAPPPP
jgi:hypothetical protein